MKLTKLYTNAPDVFHPITFREGLNVVLGEIRRPKNRERDTHNLGKTILSQVIDFCLLRKKTADFFLFKHFDRFKEFVFFLELKTHDYGLVTIRRSVENGSKAALVRHDAPLQDFNGAPEDAWDHWNVPFERAKTLLDGLLDLSAVAPWSFRNAVSYSLRTQKDYDEPFKLAKHGGKHADWKPFLAHILGLDASLVERSYGINEEISTKSSELVRLQAELAGVEDGDQHRGLVEIKQREIQQLESQLDQYNFELADAQINRELVDELDCNIAELNERKYYAATDKRRIEQALRTRVPLALNKIEKIFQQSNIYFGDQIKKDYHELELFNKAISEERDLYLKKELASIEHELGDIDTALKQLNGRRAAALVALKDKETFSKYKRLNQRLVEQRTELEVLKRQRDAVARLQLTKRSIRNLAQEKESIREEIERNIEKASNRYTTIRTYFDDIVHRVIDRHANLFTSLNKEGNVDFHVNIVDTKGRDTSAGEGHTYGRLLCIAFDMAVQRAYTNEAYPHFIYHDGALETLDARKKLNLIETIREYSAAGTQHIITVIDSELPRDPDGRQYRFHAEEVIVHLHDGGDDGRLFKMPQW